MPRFADVKARIAKTLAFLATLKLEQIDGSEARDVVIKIRGQELAFKGQD